MKSTSLLVATLVLGCAASACADEPNPRKLWHTDYSKALELARQTDRPLFVVFR